MSDFILDWSSIRPLNGSRSLGFEELCTQLAREERPQGSSFRKKGIQDAGVECFATLEDGSEWGWQAKYFHSMDDSQWSQLDSSVKTALDKHPRLIRYHVCLPIDLPDARVPNQKSAMQRWNERVDKWTNWASARNMTVRFVLWGSSELLDLLSQTKHIGRVRLWFDVRGFDASWYSSRLEEAIKTAGPRYTPEIHVELPIVEQFNTFGRTTQFFDRIKSTARGIRKKLSSFEYELKSLGTKVDTAKNKIIAQLQISLSLFSKIEYQPSEALPFSEILEILNSIETKIIELHEFISEAANDSVTGDQPQDRKVRSEKSHGRALYELSSEIADVKFILQDSLEIASNSLLILSGDAGVGKTHLLCDLAKERLSSGKPTILIMGQRFLADTDPWNQVLSQLDLRDLTAEEFVGALEASAQSANSRALVLIDAINEGTGRTLWPEQLSAFLSPLEKSAWIGTVLAVRSSYKSHIVPEDILKRAVSIEHYGFSQNEFDATKTFFIYYGLELPSTPLLNPEFRNPLFLKTICKGLHEQGDTRLPRGFHGITEVFSLFLSAINKTLAERLGYDPSTPLVMQALEELTKELIQTDKRWLLRSQTRDIVDRLLPGREFERSLFRSLIVEGLLVENFMTSDKNTHQEVVYFAYDRLADNLIARTLLDQYLASEDLNKTVQPDGPLGFLSDNSQYISPGLLEALCTQMPERTGQELTAIAPAIADHWAIGDAFRQSLIWRVQSAFSEDTFDQINQLCKTQHDLDDTLDATLTLTLIPKHPLNADFLDKRLRRDSMAQRDAWWSIYIHGAWQTRSALDRLLEWASSITPEYSLEYETIDLCATSLAWLLTSSNRYLRDRATIALVSLLTNRLPAVERLLTRFCEIDDLYILERIYAVAYGTSMRSSNSDEVGKLAQLVYQKVFANGTPPKHILLRDYARGIVERAIYLGSSNDVDAQIIRPPYNSEWPKVPSEEEIKHLIPDWSKIDIESGRNEWARRRNTDQFRSLILGRPGRRTTTIVSDTGTFRSRS